MVALSASVLGMHPSSAADEAAEEGAIIVSPKDGATVGNTADLEGRLLAKESWPAILVKPDVADQPWYVQVPVDEVTDGKFTSKVYFGDENSKAGDKFHVVIVVAKNKETAQGIYEKGKDVTTLGAPPKGWPRSKQITVKRGG
jgi:hypothetical protein